MPLLGGPHEGRGGFVIGLLDLKGGGIVYPPAAVTTTAATFVVSCTVSVVEQKLHHIEVPEVGSLNERRGPCVGGGQNVGPARIEQGLYDAYHSFLGGEHERCDSAIVRRVDLVLALFRLIAVAVGIMALPFAPFPCLSSWKRWGGAVAAFSTPTADKLQRPFFVVFLDRDEKHLARVEFLYRTSFLDLTTATAIACIFWARACILWVRISPPCGDNSLYT
mmetsp:Transcript_54075/g.161873  ORF Transcript_54075/g.161873 Transcript_54075/m.161873 type:complete len:221 (-) Transcript_54075:886-1548(-)